MGLFPEARKSRSKSRRLIRLDQGRSRAADSSVREEVRKKTKTSKDEEDEDGKEAGKRC